MNIGDVEATMNWLSRLGGFEDSYNRDLIEDAVFNLEHGNEYRAASSLRTLASNLRSAGKPDLADGVERLL